jgi:hypothetical protein
LDSIEAEEVATSTDQRLKVVEIKALLAIGRELARIHDAETAS